jgi:hypothetical protein
MRGGKREGAGRHPVPPSQSKALPNKTIRCTPEEYQQLKEYLKQLRSVEK